MRADEIMSMNVMTVSPDTHVRDVAKKLLERGVSALPVVDGEGHILGIISEGDLMRRRESGIREVRGPGLMVASELADPARVPLLTKHCLEEGRLILMNAGTLGDAIRWMPPLVVTEAEIDQALTAFGKALAATR